MIYHINCREASKKFSRILWRRPRPKLAVEPRKEEREDISYLGR
jgi:hypothetical protein